MRRALRLTLLVSAVLVAVAGCEGSGDRVLVSKFQYASNLSDPKRFEVVVFKYPERPVENNIPKNYIKRLLGLPGEILAIFFGRLFRMPAPPAGAPPYYPDVDNPQIALDLWEKHYMHVNDEQSKQWFEAGKFEPVRKPPEIMLALRRIVNDNDFQPADLKGKVPPRWNPLADSSWQPDGEHKVYTHAGAKADAVDWLRYRHLRVERRDDLKNINPKPSLITDFMGYNDLEQLFASQVQAGGPFRENDIDRRWERPLNWVGDLMLECKLTVDKAEGEFWMELSKGIHRFRARWQLDSGTCTLYSVDYASDAKGDWLKDKEGKLLEKAAVKLASTPTRLKNPGSYTLRFANFDSRLTVWVNRDLPFGDGHEYPPPEILSKEERDKGLKWEDVAKRRGPTVNDLEPASLGSKAAAVRVGQLRLWRDTYYTLDPEMLRVGRHEHDFTDPNRWDALRNLDYRTMYVQPGHYLCLGDNSPSSADSRQWGVVPDRLMLGRALMVYFPLDRIGPIR